jgi:hypothetical protein
MFTLMTAMFCAAAQGEPGQSPFSHFNMPVHGTLHKQRLFGFFGERSPDRFNLDLPLVAIPIDNPEKKSWTRINMGLMGGDFQFRHHVRDRILWFSLEPARMMRIPIDDLHLVDPANEKRVDQFNKKYPVPGTNYGGAFGGVFSYALHEKYSQLMFSEGYSRLSAQGPPKGFVGSDFVPISENGCRIFFFPKKNKEIETWETHARFDAKKGRWEVVAGARFEKIGQWIADLDSNDFRKRAKAFEELDKLGDLARPALEKLLASKPAVETRQRAQMLLEKLASGESKAERLTKEADKFEKFPSLFVEDFMSFLRKDDYYFVTQSGKLYHAPPPKEGEKSRTMKPLWTDAKRPIVAVIEDAGRDKVWLFAKDKNKDAKLDLCFEMKETIRTETFDPAKLRPVNVEGRAKILLEYLPLISADPKK